MSIKLLIDSGADLSQELAKKYDIGLLPLTTICNGVEYKDGIDISSKQLNERMRQGDVFSTAQITVDQYVKAFNEEVKRGNEVLCLTLSSGITGTINSARIAKDLILEENPSAVIEIIDSKLASYSFGLLARRIVEYINAGFEINKIVNIVNEIIKNTFVTFTVDDLKYLHRGGRVSSVQKVVGGMLNIKPILIVDHEGRLIPVDKARGLKKVYKKFTSMIYEEVSDDIDKDQLVIIGHSDSKELAIDLKNVLINELGFTNIYIDEIGAVISSHTGPGCIEMTLLKKNMDDFMNIKM